MGPDVVLRPQPRQVDATRSPRPPTARRARARASASRAIAPSWPSSATPAACVCVSGVKSAHATGGRERLDSRGALAERNNPDSLVSVAGREIVATRAFVISVRTPRTRLRIARCDVLRSSIARRCRLLARFHLLAWCALAQVLSSRRGGPTARTAIDARTLGADATGVARRLRLAAPVRVASEAVRGCLAVALQAGSAQCTLA